MSDRILHKRSLTKGSIPTTSSLENGELAINVADGKVYLKKSGSNGESIESAITTNSSAVGDITLTGSLFVSASQPVSIIGQLNVNGVTSSLHGTADTASYVNWNNIDNRPIFTSQSVFNNFTQSTNLQLTSLEVESGSVRGRLSNIESFSSSQLILNPTFATTGSNSFKGNQAISGSVTITGSLTVVDNSKFGHIGSNTHQFTGSVSVSGSFRANGLTYPLQDNGEFSFFQSDGAGNVTLQYVNTLYETIYNGETTTITKGTPVYVSGSQGAEPKVYRADAGDPLKMPVIYITSDNIAPAATGRGAVLGLITGVDTTGYPPGTEVYVGVGGGWTATRPTGSAIVQTLGLVTKEGNGGQGVILNPGPNNIPNLKEGNFWIGDYRWEPTYVSTASFESTASFNQYTSSVNSRLSHLETETGSIRTTLNAYTQSTNLRLNNIESNTGSYARTNTNNIFTGLQTFTDISVNGTASFAYIQSTTGSAKIIGDAFIVLNNNTPSQRYAGITVIDSGSNPSTSSFYFDGELNDWNYEYSSSAGVDYAVALFGPEYQTKESPTYLTDNRIPKATDKHHLIDSNISDDGVKVQINIPLNVTTSITGSTIYATNKFVGNLNGTADTASYVEWNSVSNKPLLVSQSTFTTYQTQTDDRLNYIEIATASIKLSLSNINSFTESVNLRVNNLELESGSVRRRLSNIENFTSSQQSINLTLQSYTESINTKFNTLGTYTSSNDTTNTTQNNRLDLLSTFSGSANSRLNNIELFTSSIDTTIKTKLNIEGVISGSSQLTSSYDTRYETRGRSILSGSVLNYIPVIVSQSSQINFNELSNISQNIVSSSTDNSTVDITINNGSISVNLIGGVVSGSTQVNYNELSNISSNIVSQSTDTSTVDITINNGSISANLIGGVVSGSSQIQIDSVSGFTTYSSSVDSRFINIETYTSSNDITNTIQNNRLDLLSTFSGSSNDRLIALETESGSIRSALNSYTSSADSRILSLENYSSSNDITNTAQNNRLTSLESYTSSNDATNTTQNNRLDGLSVFSGSANNRLNSIELYSSSLKSAISLNGSNVTIVGDLKVSGTTTIIDSTTVQIGDNIIELNGTGTDAGGIYVKDATGVNINTGSLIWDSAEDVWKAGIKGSEIKILRSNGDSVVSGSSQVSYLGLSNIPSGIVSGSSQVNFNELSNISANIVSASSDTSTVDITINNGSISANLIGGVVSGSTQIQINNVNGFTTYSSSVDNRLDNLELESGSVRTDFNLFTSSYNTGSFSGSFVGDGSGIVNVTFDIAGNTTYSLPFTSSTSITVNHLLNSAYPLVQVYDNNDEQVLPTTIKVLNSSSIQVDFNESVTGNIVVAKAGHIITGSSFNAENLNGQPPSYYLNWNNFTNIPITYYKESVSGSSTYTVNHNLNEDLPIVQVYDTNKEQVIPFKVQSNTTNQISVEFTSIFSGSIVVKV